MVNVWRAIWIRFVWFIWNCGKINPDWETFSSQAILIKKGSGALKNQIQIPGNGPTAGPSRRNKVSK